MPSSKARIEAGALASRNARDRREATQAQGYCYALLYTYTCLQRLCAFPSLTLTPDAYMAHRVSEPREHSVYVSRKP